MCAANRREAGLGRRGAVSAVAVMLEQVTTALGQDDSKVSPPVQPNRVDQSLLAQVAQVAAAWIRRPVGVVP